MKKQNKDWEKEFDDNFRDRFKGHISWVESKDLPNDVKSFIHSLLSQKEKEVREEIAKQLEITILFREKATLDGNIIDWPSDLRAFIKYYLKEKNYDQ